MFSIRTATIEEIPLVRDIAITVYSDTFGEAYTPAELEDFLNDTYNLQKLRAEFYEAGARLYIALDDQDIIGFLRLRSNKQADAYLGTNHIELHQLYIHRNYHGGIVPVMILEEALRYAAEKGYEWMWLSVWENNIRAQRFYIKNGFEHFSECSYEIAGDPQTDWLLKRKLSRSFVHDQR